MAVSTDLLREETEIKENGLVEPAPGATRPEDGGRGEVVVSVRNVSKKFCKNLRRSMAYGIADLGRNLVGIKPDSTALRKDEFWALDDVSFDLRRGEALGLIGVNGTGKTTLLRLIAGIFPPDRGEITVKGRVGALIAVGAGFHPHMTGRENVYLNGAILGMGRLELDDRLQDIVEFAEIGDFLDAPVSAYSSGMRVRLGFSIATAIQPRVLLVDEILAVGDAVFRRRCFERMRRVMQSAAIVFVSHQMRHVEQFCTKAILLTQGRVTDEGNVRRVTSRYMEEANKDVCAFTREYWHLREGSGEIVFTDDVKVYGIESGPNRISHRGEDLVIEASFTCRRPMKSVRFRVAIEDLSSGVLITAANCHVPEVRSDGRLQCRFRGIMLRPHAYSILLAVTDLRVVVDLWPNASSLVAYGGHDKEVDYSATDRDLVYLPHEISVETDAGRHVHSPGDRYTDASQ